MVWLPDGAKISKISLFVLTQLTNVTDTQTHTQTPHDGLGRAYASHRAARIGKFIKLRVQLNSFSSFCVSRVPPGQTGRRRHNVVNLSVRPFVRSSSASVFTARCYA